MVAVRIYVEGGGDSSAQKADFRQGLVNFWTKGGLKGKMPRTIVCGSRNDAYSNFCTALKTHKTECSILLVDSEDPFPADSSKWDFLRHRDGWETPPNANEDNVFLMVQTMESWLLADREALRNFYGNGFNSKVLPAEENPVESLTKDVMYSALERATKGAGKGAYSKGGHSFQLIGLIDPNKVISASSSAKLLIEQLSKIL
jgi:hypothetical protein